MQSGPPLDDEAAEIESGRELVQIGAETLSGIAGGAAGAFLGPVGAIAGAAGTPALIRLFRKAGRAVQRRLLNSNEEVRIGGALAVAVALIEERQEAGEEPRHDGLFDPDADPRGVLEGTLMSAARSYDELKVPYIGAFYASFAFEESVDVNTAHYLIGLWDRLTYHGLVTLAYFADPESSEERTYIQAAAEEEGTQMTPLVAADLATLTSVGLLGIRGEDGRVTAYGSTVGTLGGGDLTMAKVVGTLAPMELGATLVRMAELDKIPDDDKRGIGDGLRGTSPS
jgi:hypothetical protein